MFLLYSSGFPPNLPTAVFVTVHTSSDAPSLLPEILTWTDSNPAIHPEDGQQIEHGRIYVAPPDMHMLVEKGHIRLSHGPKVNLSRPAVDPMFNSASMAYGERVIGIVLTGQLSDGTAGLATIKKRGGCTFCAPVIDETPYVYF
ncbi:MAG: chemotaxis protein CheB [Armatimonadota bacterium]